MEQFSELKNFTAVEPRETRVKTTGGQTIVMRIAHKADFDAVDALLAQSYPKTLTGHYLPSVMALAMPKIARANMRLLRSGRYFLAHSESGRLLGAGGYSLEAPGGRKSIPGTAHIRHVVTDHAHQGRGIGRAILRHSLAQAAQEGINRFDCLSTVNAEGFYAGFGFRSIGPVELPLAPGIRFPAVQMQL